MIEENEKVKQAKAEKKAAEREMDQWIIAEGRRLQEAKDLEKIKVQQMRDQKIKKIMDSMGKQVQETNDKK